MAQQADLLGLARLPRHRKALRSVKASDDRAAARYGRVSCPVSTGRIHHGSRASDVAHAGRTDRAAKQHRILSAIAVSTDGTRLYIADRCFDQVVVNDTAEFNNPRFSGPDHSWNRTSANGFRHPAHGRHNSVIAD